MYAYYMFHKQKMLPSEFVSLPDEEKAAIMAFIDEKLREEKKQQAEMKAKSKRKR